MVKGRLGYCDPKLKATIRPTPQDLTFAAGFYEGEGTCQFRFGQKQRHGTSCSIIQKDKWIIDWFRERFGGGLREIRIKRRTVPSERRTYYRLDFYGARARGFLQTIYKFLSPRRQEQIRRAMEIGEFSVKEITPNGI